MSKAELPGCPVCYSKNVEVGRLIEGKKQFGFEHECLNCGTVFKMVIITISGPTKQAMTNTGNIVKPMQKKAKEKQ